ncbi:uncharacterized protein [Populus alba]|uniref:uncharacterized protein isoform X1 n=1 Tax=Populus alba TaxID=43335 RepID=UPI003CC74EAE
MSGPPPFSSYLLERVITCKFFSYCCRLQSAFVILVDFEEEGYPPPPTLLAISLLTVLVLVALLDWPIRTMQKINLLQNGGYPVEQDGEIVEDSATAEDAKNEQMGEVGNVGPATGIRGDGKPSSCNKVVGLGEILILEQ